MDTVEDVKGHVYQLLPVPPEKGGQGKVYPVRGLQYAVKLINAESPVKREGLRQRLALVQGLDIEELSLAKPLYMLKPPHVGYVMKWLADMHALRKLIHPPKGEPSVREWYLRTGGLQRRLRLLARCADVLAQLHGKGLVYSDISPSNVFVSAPNDKNVVFLIDTDNLHAASDTGEGLYTRGYGAPEVMKGLSGVSTLTDAWSFAVLAYETLCLVQPFISDEVHDGPPELEQQAYLGELPWIGHSESPSKVQRGIPPEHTVSKQMRELFVRCFEAGLQDPRQRPGLTRWSEALHKAANHCLQCPRCHAHYLVSENECPWCDEPRPTYLYGQVRQWSQTPVLNDGYRKANALDSFVLGPNQTIVITDQLLAAGLARHNAVELAELRFDGQDFQVKSLDGQTHLAVTADGREDPFGANFRRYTSSFALRINPTGLIYREITITLRKAKA